MVSREGPVDRRNASIAVAALLACVLFASVSTAGGVELWIEPQWDPAPISRDPLELEAPIGLGEPVAPEDRGPEETIELPAWLSAVLRVLIVLVGFAAVGWVLLGAWRNRPRLRWRRLRGGETEFEVLPDVAAAVVEQAAAQRAVLLAGAPRNVIVRCWLQLEADVRAAGLERHPADTSVEFTERVLADYSVDPEAIVELAALYREARFSEHPLDETDRQAALAALDRLHRTLEGSKIAATGITATRVETTR